MAFSRSRLLILLIMVNINLELYNRTLFAMFDQTVMNVERKLPLNIKII